jgi:hypothetical protein
VADFFTATVPKRASVLPLVLPSTQSLSEKLNGKKLQNKNAGLIGPADSCSSPCGETTRF